MSIKIRHEITQRVKSKGRSDAAAVQLLWLRDKKSPTLLPGILKTDARWKELCSGAGYRCEHRVFSQTQPLPPRVRACVCVCATDPLTLLTPCQIALYKSILFHLAEVLLSPM